MKKLLALILCVMMFVSVMSTSAFAAYDPADQRVWKGADQSKDIVDALRKNIENMYGSIAVDNAAVSTMKSIILQELLFLNILALLTHMFVGSKKESCRTAARIHDSLIYLRINNIYNG